MFNAEFATMIMFGLVAMVSVNVGFAYLLARLSNRRIAAELVRQEEKYKSRLG